MQVRSLGWEDPLEEGMAIHSIILAWRIPWTEAPVHGVTEGWTRLSDFTLVSLNIEQQRCCLVADSCLTLCDFMDPCQALPSMGFPRQEYCNRLPFPSPGNPPDPGTEPVSPTLAMDSLSLSPNYRSIILWNVPREFVFKFFSFQFY